MLKRVLQKLSRIPLWLRIVGGALLTIVVCGALIYVAFMVSGLLLMFYITLPTPCVDGGPGSPATYGGTHLFTFPESAANIHSSCTTWQSAEIDVWFEMDADELEPFLDSMRWDVRPLVSTDEPPSFGNPRWNATYLYGTYSNYPEGGSVWIDTSRTPYRVYVNVWLD